MFSIARFTGDEDEQKDNRSFEKKKERLDKLNARIKKRKDDSTVKSTEKKIKLDTKEKQPEKTAAKNEQESEQEQEEEKVEEVQQEPSDIENDIDIDTENDKEEKITEAEEADEAEEEEEAMEVDNVPTLEAFPEMVLPKTKHSKEEVKILKSMGIPEWLLQPTVVSPKSSCDLDNVGLSKHIIQRCQDLGLTSLFAGKQPTIYMYIIWLTVCSSNGCDSCVFEKKDTL